MAITSQAYDGRYSLAFLAKNPDATVTTLAAGDFGFVLDNSVTVFKDIPEGRPFWANTAVTCTAGSFVKMDLTILGFAQSKSYSMSKNTTDVTIDYDESTNNITDGQVTTSGSISGVNMVEEILSGDEDDETAFNIIRSRFGGVTQIDASGNVIYLEANTTEKDILVLVYNARNIKEGSLMFADVIPAIFSNLQIQSDYNSSQTFQVDFTGNYSDENGYLGGSIQVAYVDGMLPSITRP